MTIADRAAYTVPTMPNASTSAPPAPTVSAAPVAPAVVSAATARRKVPLTQPLRLQTQVYAREVPHLKHAATFGLTRARRQAVQAGFDDALFVDGDGRISEGSIWNIGFVQGEAVVWPEAPMLAGTGQALLQREMADLGLSSTTRPVFLSDLGTFDAAFICNSATPACAVAAIDGQAFPPAGGLIPRLIDAWRSNPRQKI